MSRINNIIKFGLESRAKELFSNSLSLVEIAKILSDESKQNISNLTVFRYFNTEDQLKAQAIEKKAELQVKVAEAEISTIEDRKKVIKGLLSLAENAEYDRDKVAAYKVATEALDSLDKRLGKLTGNSGVTINNINAMKLSDIPTDQLRRLIDDARCRSH